MVVGKIISIFDISVEVVLSSDNVKIGANAVILKNVEAGSTIVGIPGKIK